MGVWLSRLVAVAMFIGGGLALYFGIIKLNHANESEKWPSVPGKITSTRVQDSVGRKGRRNYKPIVNYSYSVNSRGYTGDRISFGEYSSSNRQSAEDIVNKYRAMPNVQVFYDPQIPAESVLEPGVTMTVYILPGVGVLFLIIGGFLTFSMIFSRSEEDQSELESKPPAASPSVNPQDSFDFGPPRR